MTKADKPPREKRPRRLRRALLWLVAAVLLLVVLGPTIVGNSPLLGVLLDKAVPPTAGRLTARSAGGGWLGQLHLSGVALSDSAGQSVLEADELRINQSLLDLIRRRQSLMVLADRPTMHVVVRPGGSNVQDLLTALQQQQAEQAPSLIGDTAEAPRLAALAVRNATVYVSDTASGGHWTHQNIQCNVDLTGGVSQVEAEGRLGTVFNQFEPLAGPDAAPNFTLQMQPTQGAARSVTLSLTGAPANVLDPLLHHVDPTARITGLATGGGTFTWNAPPVGGDPIDQLMASGLATEGSIALEQFAAQGRVLGGDVLRLANLAAPWKARVDNGQVVVEDMRINSDVGAARLRGTLSAAELKNLLSGDTRQAAWPRGRLGADLDVARLVQLAPRAVSLRDDVRPISGRILLNLETEQQNGARIAGDVTAAGFAADVAGQRVAWDKPFTLSGAVARGPNGLVAEGLRCQSDFLAGELSGDLSNLNGRLTFNLNRLAEQLGQWLDLRDWRLSGEGNAEVRVQSTAADRRSGTLVASLSKVAVAHQGVILLQEESLTASGSGEGQFDPATARLTALSAARIGVESGDDKLIATLAQPMRLDAPQPRFTTELHGDVTSWQNRARVALAPVLGVNFLRDYRAAGKIDLTASGSVGQQVVQLSGVSLHVVDLAIDGGNLAIREPKVDVTGDFLWDGKRGVIESRDGQVLSSTMTLASRALRAQAVAGQTEASGEVALLTDLERLNKWFAPSDRPLPSGRVEAMIALSRQQGQLRADINAKGARISFVNPNTQQPLLQEPELTGSAQVAYSEQDQLWMVNSATVNSNTLRVQATGSSSAGGAAQFNGVVDYDLTAWAPVLAGYVGPEVRVTGRHQGRFSLARAALAGQTPHWSRAWRGNLQLPWTTINLFGLPIGQGQLDLSLADGRVQTEPIRLAVSGGMLTTQLSARLDPPPAAWAAAPGPVLTDVQLTPEICDRMLKYIAPVLANATRNQGVFSLRVDNAGGPLDPLRQLGVKGQLDAKQVAVRPGPSTVELVKLIRQVEALIKNGDASALLGAAPAETTLLAINSRTIDFSIENGRVHHSGLQFEVGDVTVLSRGSVGLDETLDLVLAVPVKDEWVARRPVLLGGLKGQQLTFPIRGTLSRPAIDQRAFADLSQRLLRDGVRGALDRLFGN
ncbi:MAG: hypothetical protein KDA37_01585 [Planctomycetales bacterium]|nr:hypothetical protein [Planctomycetales bacterium]